ncbi:hypothetical protein CC86DRAFT_143392 [Ophiobolus disseminans]|uniref:Galactose oxidase n=1 Tax=Ophiobolus disseminans TaxID=1469910 RepID=A0A6A7AEP1_9PLEO|nr:hypothetical protein CC86DRAFT_143392 [Ophiobolus disseminans]
MKFVRLCIFCLIGLSLASVSRQNDPVPLDYFCMRTGHSIVKKGDAIYAYGGLRNPKVFNETYPYDHALVKLDLSYSWRILYNDQPMTLVSSLDLADHPPPRLIESSIFYDHNHTFHVYGGGLATSNASSVRQTTTSPVQNRVWTLSSNESWSSSPVKELDPNYAPMHALSVRAPEHDLVFYLNGILSNGSDEHLHVFPKMIIMNTRTKEVRVVSTNEILPDTARVGAVLQYLPLLGTRGALVLFGGATRHKENVTTDTWGTMVPLDVIHIFDIASLDTTPNGIWYRQSTSGRTPSNRMITCAISILSPDRTNYYIYISSGHSPTEIHDDVWVLSLPQFHWTQVFSGSRSNYGSVCHLVGNKQLLVLGGIDRHAACQRSPYVSLFDVTNLKWERSYVKDDEAFRVPKAVSDWIGGSAMGEAKIREPEPGFMSPGLAMMFDGITGSRMRSTAMRKVRITRWAAVGVLPWFSAFFLL